MEKFELDVGLSGMKMKLEGKDLYREGSRMGLWIGVGILLVGGAAAWVAWRRWFGNNNR